MKIVEGSTHSTYEIDPLGLKGSQRAELDGKVYAGTKYHNSEGKIANDIILNNAESLGDRHFVI